jgi:hypothetical protein
VRKTGNPKMPRIEAWNPNKFDEIFENIAIDRLTEACEAIAVKARSNLNPQLNLSRPKYKTGKDAGKNWTSRDAGRLKKSIRVVRRKTKSGKAFSRKRNVRVYAGHYKAFYAYWTHEGSSMIKRKKIRKGKKKKEFSAKEIEFGAHMIPAQPFLRTAFYSSMDEIKSIIGVR